MTNWCLSVCLVSLVIALTGLTMPGESGAQVDEPVISQEYFIQQAVDEDLLITISAFEAEFESRVLGENGQVLITSGVPGSRIVPVFQYINAPRADRQLDIQLTSGLHTGRTEFGIELTRLKPWDSRSNSLSQAYRQLSYGTESSGIDSQANWTAKIENLVNAGRLFQQFGMQEMRLWAKYLSAHLIHFHLHDHSMVYSMTRDILADVKGTRLQKIELASLQLHSLALIQLRRSGLLSQPSKGADPVQVALARTAVLAGSMGYYFEQARALYSSGLEYAEEPSNASALEQFDLAVKAADSVGSAELATAIRESIVKIHTIQGDAPATSEVLQEIESQLAEDGGGDELALNLLAQARLLSSSYHYGEAISVLSESLSYENNSAIRRQIHFELAKILYETGRLSEALDYLKLADISADSGQIRQGNLVIDVGEGLQILANIYRMTGEFELMQRARRAQGRHKTSASQYLYDQGLDGVVRAGTLSQQAGALFKQSYSAAVSAGNFDLKHLSRLQYCVLAGSGDSLCSKTDLNTSYQWLLNGAVPRFTAEGMFLWAKMQRRMGRRSEASSVLEQLVDRVHLLRHSLPGVLGVWYWEQNEKVFETWLGLLVSGTEQKGGVDESVSLLALSKIRHTESYSGSELVVNERTPENDLLRDQLAQRAAPGTGSSVLALNDRINKGLGKLEEGFIREFEFLSRSGLQKYLRSLNNDEQVLTYHISPDIAQVWVGHKGRVYRRSIASPESVYSALQSAQTNLANIGIDAFNQQMAVLGKQLIGPVADLLKKKIYWIPAGPLLAFPVDALRIKSDYLIEKHMVINLLSFPQNVEPGKSLQTGSMDSIFLAGNPQDYSGDYATRLDTSSEISAVADLFIGPGLQIIQGVALLPDEFQGGYFLDSKLLHLSMPGVIDLQHPGDSGLELSESEYAPGRMILRPEIIRKQQLSADLAFLSATRITKTAPPVFSGQPGLVTDFTKAGVRSVIANIWAIDSGSNEFFITDFYRKLQKSGNVADSIHESRLQYLKSGRENDLYDWAGYQLFIQ